MTARRRLRGGVFEDCPHLYLAGRVYPHPIEGLGESFSFGAVDKPINRCPTDRLQSLAEKPRLSPFSIQFGRAVSFVKRREGIIIISGSAVWSQVKRVGGVIICIHGDPFVTRRTGF
jgi:hypothetical protein